MSSSVGLQSFEAYTGDVYAWAYRLIGRHHDAQDVVQDVFLRWSAQCRKGIPLRPRGWLRRVTVNRAIDFCRRRREEVSEAEAVSAEPEGHLDQDDCEMLRKDVASSFEGLSDMQRSVLVAKLFDGLSFAEIASDHDVAVPTVKTHYLRAIRAVRDCLSPRWGND